MDAESFYKLKPINKVLKGLQKINQPVHVSDLADYCQINRKNISRYIKILETDGLIIRTKDDDKKVRYKLISLTKKGKKFEVQSETPITKKIDKKPSKKAKSEQKISRQYKTHKTDFASKKELLHIFKILAVRDIDAHKLGMSNKEVLNQRIIELIFKL